MSNSTEMLPRFETETRARRPDLGRQVNSAPASAPRRRLVRRPAGELPEVPTRRKATEKMVATFKSRGIGSKADPGSDSMPYVHDDLCEDVEPVRKTSHSSKPRSKVFLLEMSEEEYRVACDRDAFVLPRMKARKRTTITVVRHFGLCRDCKRYYGKKVDTCKDPECEDRTLIDIVRKVRISGRFLCEDTGEFRALRADVVRRNAIALARWGRQGESEFRACRAKSYQLRKHDHVYMWRKLQHERTQAGILAAAGE